MTPERWQRINAIIHDVLSRDEPDRGQALREACAGDDALLQDVRKFLAAQPGTTLANQILPEDDDTKPQPSTNDATSTHHQHDQRGHAAQPTASGASSRFERLRFHKAGGLGEVWLARDIPLDRLVALKAIQSRYLDDDNSRARFLREAEITAKLDHPNIVPVHALEHDPTGDPFYVMRFIRGDQSTLREAVRRFHDDPDLKNNPRARAQQFRDLLGRFIAVCNAVAYAHTRGVIHRDIKPSNIMLGPFGETIVIDWGLARTLSQVEEPSSAAPDLDAPVRLSDHSSGDDLTQGLTPGTPAFMSPEQAAGDAGLGPASDIFSLGATLYFLLCNREPYKADSQDEVLQLARQGEPPAPRSIARDIPRALEAICMKAMSRAPSDRYPTASALTADVERYLADDPVTALKEPLADRTRRWARKHRTLTTTTAALLLFGLLGATGFAVVLTGKNQELEKQRTKAEAREQAAIDAVKRFGDVVKENSELKNNPALESLRKTLLKEPLAFFKSLRERLQADHDTRPEALARLGTAAQDLGLLTEEIGNIDEALIAYKEARRIYAHLTNQFPAVVHHPFCKFAGS